MLTMLKEYAYDVRHRESGATATEYVVLLVFIALAIIAGATLLGGGLNTVFGDTADRLTEEFPGGNGN